MEEPQKNYLNTMDLEKDEPLKSTGPQISVSEFSCHCCYDILVNPTTLNCGHSFCRHCLALWWASSKKTECPECREKWEGFPKVNILLRLLLTLTEEEFSKTPYTIENSSHRRAILMELERVKALGMKPPQNLWEYKAVNPGRSLFLLYALKSSPRLGLLYLYLFDYTDTFLPFIHTTCPLQEDSSGEDIVTKLLDLKEPTWKQWRESWSILLPSIPADCRVCLGLAGGPLLDITVSHHQCYVTLSSGIILLLENLVKK
uniref:Macaca fascicularis brain cDNA clone: QflA-22872, similar to human bifunctional apoptosis regulator (BFAR), mRNA, RefSeq: NM_016561.1 n=1 Tax=Macaca fascicularis TaxID=9541 RepID=I7GDL1_MACFA|nr:unnamed protein product [Macaca fascicularis]